MVDKLKLLVTFLSGYKTYAVALAAVIYGVHTNSVDMVLAGLGLAGVRNGIATEIGKVLLREASKNDVTVVNVAPTTVDATVPAEVTPVVQ